MDMIERVAKAIYDNMCLANPHVMTTWEALPWDLKSYYSELARAAIKAMMEPTDEMLSESGIFITDNARVAWQAMIQSALQSASSQSPTLEKL